MVEAGSVRRALSAADEQLQRERGDDFEVGGMISDLKVKAEVAQQWDALRALCNSRRSYYLPGAGQITETPRDTFYNLPLVLAYAVLDQVLDELMGQGAFPKPKGRLLLGAKMEASRVDLPWIGYSLVEEGRVARNHLAHRAKLRTQADCFRFIDAVESELKAWGVI
jgi:hypothetical protein